MKSQSPERLVLIGPSGSGKTTVARQVAALLRWSYVDTDDLVTRVAGMPIRDIFAASGEPRFRELGKPNNGFLHNNEFCPPFP